MVCITVQSAVDPEPGPQALAEERPRGEGGRTRLSSHSGQRPSASHLAGTVGLLLEDEERLTAENFSTVAGWVRGLPLTQVRGRDSPWAASRLRPGPSRGCGAVEAALLHFHQKDGPEAAQATQRACSWEVAFFFSLRCYLFIHERHRERSRDPGRGRSRLPAGSPMWDSILGPRGHTLGRRRTLHCESPRLP